MNAKQYLKFPGSCFEE